MVGMIVIPESDTNKPDPTPQTKPLVIVVDDERAICGALERILESNGYRVIALNSGAEAVEIVKTEKPDVMLLDLMMPGMDGRQVSARVREMCDCRIIYFTARSDLVRSPVARDLNRESDALLTKPSTSKRILSTIELVLNGK